MSARRRMLVAAERVLSASTAVAIAPGGGGIARGPGRSDERIFARVVPSSP